MSNDRKPDFSGVRGGAASTDAPVPPKADFGNVQGGVHSTEASREGGGGGMGSQTYTVVAGDTLSHIAQRLLGKASAWHAIYDANRDQLDDPDVIHPGQVLQIPAA